MGDARKDPTQRRTFGRGKGLTVKGKIRTQDTGSTFGRGSGRPAKPIRRFGQGV